MSDAWQQTLVTHLRTKLTNPDRQGRIRDRTRKRLSRGGHVPSDDEIEEDIDDTLIANHGKAVKELAAKAIAYVYWKCLRDYFLELKITQEKIRKALDVSASNLSRWGKETLPDPSKIFLALVWQRIDFRSVDFPPRHKNFRSYDLVATEAARLTVEQLRVREFDKKYAQLSNVAMVCTKLLYNHKDSRVIILNTLAMARLRQDVYLEILQKLRQLFPQDHTLSVEMVEQTASQWLISYALFDLGRPSWDFLREE